MKCDKSRLVLRHIRISEKQRLFEIWDDPLVNQYTDFPGLDAPKMVQTFINMAQERFNSRNGIRWALILKENDNLIGTMGFNRWITQFGNFAVKGYDLDPEFWRRGLSYEAKSLISINKPEGYHSSLSMIFTWISL